MFVMPRCFRGNAIRVSWDFICLFKQSIPALWFFSPSYAVLGFQNVFTPPPPPSPLRRRVLSFLSLSYDPIPLQNLASHILIQQRQWVVVMIVKMVYNFSWQSMTVVITLYSWLVPSSLYWMRERNARSATEGNARGDLLTLPFGRASLVRETERDWARVSLYSLFPCQWEIKL